MQETTLSDAAIGVTVRVLRLETRLGMRRRLQDIGLTEGALSTCLFASPSGDPRAYLVRGAVIALREEDAKTIFVEAV